MTENDIYVKLTELVSEKTKVGELKPETDLSDLGLDSLDKADIMIQVEDIFHISFNEDEMAQISTIQDFEKSIESKLNNQ